MNSEDVGGEVFKREMRDLEEMLSNSNPVAEKFVSPSLGTGYHRLVVPVPQATGHYGPRLNNYQTCMGLLILEKEEWVFSYEQAKIAISSAELKLKCEKAAHASDLIDARKREDSLKKAVGIEKEFAKNIENSFDEMRAELADAKVATETKLAMA
ncbi:Hypothetical predicted protein [Olea europaea subsp. europaea]|uniref:Uncharacterized protein n=1 Tax=Olea europaea subsp. europaea TaxID=158383 RepID=A0A8S0QU57_OLEEU|nr:Hypothetical predicted protein [Olea europaea subsp. europaea]